MKISGRVIDIHQREIYFAEVIFENGIISKLERIESGADFFILPGLIDAHVHIESSMITPGAFAEIAVQHGTIGVVSDPHEIANVMGLKGIEFMLEDSKKAPIYFWFGAPSCVPATNFETAGGILGPSQIRDLLERREIKYLSEMMNYPGVIHDSKDVLEKLLIAKELGKPVDGHAPGLTGENLKKYIASGISTDHECSTYKEAIEKIELGMKILIREGSAARNLDSLKELYSSYPEMLMLCSDDIHPEMLQKGHINKLISRLVKEGYDLYDLLRSCTINPIEHYGLEAGLLRPGDPADFIIVDDPSEMNVSETWIKGKQVYADEEVKFEYVKGGILNRFNASEIRREDISVKRSGNKLRVIKAFEGELLTKELTEDAGNGSLVTQNLEKDILKIVVKDRYTDHPPSVGFISGFGLKKGAFASSVAHDSHNIICIGADDISIVNCINEIIRLKGGLAVSLENRTDSLSLNIGGIMSDNKCVEVAGAYEKLSSQVRAFGSSLAAPFMTLSFMALLVIPDLKMSDQGLFNAKNFSFTSLFPE